MNASMIRRRMIVPAVIAGMALMITVWPAPPAARAGQKATAVRAKTVRVELTVQEKQMKVLGVPVTAWTYNGTVPGPTQRVRVGDTLQMVLNNTHNLPHAIHTHFQGYSMSSDGSSMTAPLPIVPHQEDDMLGAVGGKVPGVAASPGPAVGQNPIGPYEPRHDSDTARPGETRTYTFKMNAVGTYWYHCHVFEATDHIEKGLYGAIVVYPQGWTWKELPADPGYGNTKAWVTNAKGQKLFEDVVIISDRNPAEDSAVGLAAQGGALGGPIYLANHRAWNDPYVVGPVKSGQKVLLHVGNIGESAHSWHVHSHHFYRLWQSWKQSDGAPLWTRGSIDPVPFTPIAELMNNMDIGPGDLYPTLLTAGAPGVWFAHDHVVPSAYLGNVPWLRVEK